MSTDDMRLVREYAGRQPAAQRAGKSLAAYFATERTQGDMLTTTGFRILDR